MMARRDIASLAAAAALFGATVVVLVLLRPLLPIDETRYLAVAWEMWQGGSLAVPHLNGEVYSHKPPLLFWLINMVWAVFGVSDIAARLVGPTFGVASVILTGMLARRLWPKAPDRAGFAALILATGVVFVLYGSATMFDTMLTAATVAAMLSLVALRQSPGWMAVLALAASLALGVLAKGPVILLHVMPVALLMPVWADRETRPASLGWYGRVALACVVAMVLVALWLGPALVLGGADYRADVLWRQSAGRIVASFSHDRPVWFYVAIVPLLIWPWGWSVPALRSLAPHRLRHDEASRFAALWCAAALAGFSLISGKQVHYLLPELPALALLLSGMAVAPATVWHRVSLVLPAMAVLALAGAVLAGAVAPAQVNGAVMSPLIAVAVLIVVAGLVTLVFSAEFSGVSAGRSSRWAAAAAAPATLLALHLSVGPMIWAGYDPAPIAAVLAMGQDKGVATPDTGHAGQFTFAGRLNAPVTRVYSAQGLADWMEAHPGGTVLLRDAKVAVAGLTPVLVRKFHGKTYTVAHVATEQP